MAEITLKSYSNKYVIPRDIFEDTGTGKQASKSTETKKP